MASDKQIKFIQTLASERVNGGVYVQTQLDAAKVGCLTDLSTKDASNIIGVLMGEPKVKSATPVAEETLPVGIYKAGDTLVRVYKGQQSGKNLVKKVIPSSGGYDYEYVGSALRVAAGTSSLGHVTFRPITQEEAASWGHLTGSCIVCGRHLDDPESVDAGIGPVCAKKF